MQLADLKSKPCGVKVSEISLTALLDSASILHQGHTITNSFAMTGFMSPLILMIKAAIFMVIKSRGFYNVIHHICAGKFRTKIFPLNMYSQLDLMKKYRLFVKIFCIATNNKMNAYHSRLHLPRT